MSKAKLYELADRTQKRAVRSHANGDFLAAARQLATARRYREAARP